MIGRSSAVCCIVLCAAAWAAAAPFAMADTVGAVEQVKRNVYGKPPEAASETPKYPGNPVVYQETIKTLIDSAALIRFDDGSKLTVGAKSVVQLDQFVYDPQKNTGQALLSVTGGAIRFVTGAMPKGNTTIVTPTATMVLRGTEVTVKVDPDGTTTLNVISGSVDTKAKNANQNATVSPGHSLRIGRTGFAHDAADPAGATNQEDANDLGGNNPTGDPVVDKGMGGGVTGGTGRSITTDNGDGGGGGSGPGPGGSGATSNHNAGGGHGNNGNL